MSRFLPKNYSAPKTSSGNYMKWQDGENKFRILSEPIMGWQDWTMDNKPIRYRYEKNPKPINESRPVKHFWAMIVWNYAESKIQILEIIQVSVRDGILKLILDKDWGDPYFYDIKVIKTGKEKMTKYSINPLPHKPVSAEIKEDFELTPINLEKLFDGQNPFECSPDDATPGIFEKGQGKAVKTSPDELWDTKEIMAPMEELKEHLELDNIPSEKLEDWVKLRCQTKNETVETVLKTCLEKTILPKFKKAFSTWLNADKEAFAV